jgi:flagellar protein FlbT
MPFRMSLKPHERVILGGAVLRNGRSRTELVIENEIPVLREPDILSPSRVRTPCQRVYLALQLLYLDAPRAEQHRDTYRALAADVWQAAPSCRPLLGAIDELVERGQLYQALKRAQALIEHERGLMAHVQ